MLFIFSLGWVAKNWCVYIWILISGLCGLKTDDHDITKLVDHISLNDVLDGTYECPSLGKDKGKKAINATENILHSVVKACFILHFSRPAHLQNFAETDVYSNEKMPTCPSYSVSIVENGDSSATDISSSTKVSSMKLNARECRQAWIRWEFNNSLN